MYLEGCTKQHNLSGAAIIPSNRTERQGMERDPQQTQQKDSQQLNKKISTTTQQKTIAMR